MILFKSDFGERRRAVSGSLNYSTQVIAVQAVTVNHAPYYDRLDFSVGISVVTRI